MGVLYYIAKTDGSRELFALNKVFRYDPLSVLPRLQDKPHRSIQAVFGREADLSDALSGGLPECPECPECPDRDIHVRYNEEHTSWYKRIAARLFKWAGSAPLDFMSEFTQAEFHDGLSYTEQRTLITGSAHDSDYEDDGVTYKVGSAW